MAERRASAVRASRRRRAGCKWPERLALIRCMLLLCPLSVWLHDSELRFVWPGLIFRSVELKKLYGRPVVHDERDRDTLRRAVRLDQHLLTCDSRPDVIDDECDMRDGLDQLRQITARLELHPLNAIRALEIPGCIELVALDVILFRQRSVRRNADVMKAEFRHNAKVSDGSQPPMTFDLSLSESAGSRSLDRLVPAIRNPWAKRRRPCVLRNTAATGLAIPRQQSSKIIGCTIIAPLRASEQSIACYP